MFSFDLLLGKSKDEVIDLKAGTRVKNEFQLAPGEAALHRENTGL